MDILHFDTYDNNSTYVNKNSYDTTFKLSNPLRNIKNIYLKSLEMALVFDNIRSDNTSNILTVTVNNVPHTATLATKNYNDINTLLSDINTAFSGSNITLSVLNYQVSITVPTASTISISNSVLANVILGFAKDSIYTNVSKATAKNKYTLSYDNFLSLYVDIPSKATSSGSHLISFKIPLNALENMVYYLGDNNTFNQYIQVSDAHFVLSQFRITVYDRFGYTISQSLDYTFSLAFQFL
jgi:hypothetical protein